MTREWQPGDVALVTYKEPMIALVRPRTQAITGSLEFAYASGGYDMVNDPDVTARPLVVIDPVDREQVERLYELFSDTAHESPIDGMQAALREFANPTPVEVYEHYLTHPAGGGGVPAKSICGKVWTPSDKTVSVGRCPDCVAIVEAGWAK